MSKATLVVQYLSLVSFGLFWAWLGFHAHYGLGFFPLWESILAASIIFVVLVVVTYAFVTKLLDSRKGKE